MSGAPVDTLRQYRAKQDLQTERDRLIKRADRRIILNKYLPDDGKDRARAILIATPMAVCGMLPYISMILLWFFVYHVSFVQTMTAAVALIVLGGLFCIGSSPRVMGKERRWMMWFGMIWMQAVVAGLVVGFFLYFRDLAYYWKYEEMRTYTNVAAAQPSDGFGDGSMFLFTEDSRLDAMRSVGFKSRWTGRTYCAAPVVDVTMNQAHDIYFWAVGDDCCSARAEFLCDDASDFTTRSALRVLEPEDVARPFMRWAVRGANYPKFIDAVRLQEATYFTKAAPRPTLVYWTRDPIAYKDSFYRAARATCIKVSIVYFSFVAVGAFMIAWTLVPLQKQESVIRH
mmetsp:Transcript_118787/g.341004  ORF Transcript_118787/g.341004 Transcript_118787/m.341004 type:complete len:342 (-) Transcript_118787:80-1105(-)